MGSNKDISHIINKALPQVRVPNNTDRVYKDECMFCFDTPESDGGLFICLNRFWGLGLDHVESYFKITGNSLYLHCRRIKRKVMKEMTEGPEKKITRLAIGVEGGFDGNDTFEYDIQESFELAVFPGCTMIPLSSDIIPAEVIKSIKSIQAAESASKLAELEALAGTWDGEVRRVSKHAHSLVQFDNGKKIPPRGWKCEAEGCNLKDNLWLNLTDGSILCGRRYADGSGGNNHASDHYAVSKFPLAVKLGTITPDGRGDVYSYDEDDMVEDPNLVKHLAHFGIDVAVLEKTDKSMIEMEIELNQKQSEWNTIQESGTKLKPLYGPGFTGMVNLGNSCYLNSVMQLLLGIPNFKDKFSDEKIFETVPNPTDDLKTQLTKLCIGLNSGKYSKKKEVDGVEAEQIGINPITFRSLVGKGHREFATKRQQDAQEFFLHIINLMDRQFRLRNENPAEIFKFEVEDKVVCDVTGMVRYTHRIESCLPLPIPIGAATNKAEVAAYEAKKAELEACGNRSLLGDLIRLKIQFQSCVDAFNGAGQVEFYSSGAKQNCTGTKFTRLSTFPDYLVIQLQKFTVGDDWQPKKLDVSVDMPFELDLTPLRGHGLQPNEVLLPEDSKPSAPAADETVVNQLKEMGFHPNAAKRAVISSGNVGGDAAMNWIMMHMDDPNLNDPLDEVSGKAAAVAFVPNDEAILSISGMGFTPEQAVKALKATDNNVERAIDWIFSHQDEMDTYEAPAEADAAKTGAGAQVSKCIDGHGKYNLLGFVSHMGTSTMCGHYVAHIRKNDQWVIFNDTKVAVSEKLPKDLGYLYFYRRASQ